MEKHTYLLINLLSISVPFIFSFHPKLRFDREWRRFWPACLIAGAIFISWDVFFTQIGVWGFNERYLTGFEIINLPLEEWMFFICIPYACVFTYHCLKKLIKYNPVKESFYITLGFAVIILITGLLNTDKLYTSVTFISTAGFLLIHLFVLKSPYLGKFYFAYLVILLPFFIVNGILTGSFIEQEVVWYNNHENMGIRMFTIPVEDSIYGMFLILLNVTLYEQLARRKRTKITGKLNKRGISLKA